MKKGIILLSAGVLFFAFHAGAQFRPGTLMVGSTLGATSYTSGNSDYGYDNGSTRSTSSKAFSLSAGPQLGVFVSPNVVLGGTITVNATNTKTNTSTVTAGAQGTNNANTTNYTVGFGPFMRVYFANAPADNLFFMQIHGSLATGSGNSSGDGASTTSSYNSSGTVSNILNWNAGGSLGITHFFGRHIGMDIAAGYLYSKSRSDNANSTNSVNSSTGKTSVTTNNYTLTSSSNGISFTLGFHWFLFH